MRERRIVNLRCRTADRTPGAARGASALAALLAERTGTVARAIGSPGEPVAARWEEDVREAHGCLLEAGGQIDDALADGAFPVLTAADCSIAVTTLPAVARREPEVRFAWLDAHGDFNTPATSGSGYLGGMCLAAACGRWDAGFAERFGAIDPAAVVMAGVRDVDGGEQVELERAGVGRARPSELAELLRDRRVFVHLDLDVLDPDIFPAGVPAPHGMSDTGLRTLLGELARSADVIGIEITALEAPEDPAELDRVVALAADVVAPLLG